jgi:hypothetical protein
VARTVSLSRGDLLAAHTHAKSTRATERVCEILHKAATTAGSTVNWSDLVGYSVLSEAFSASLRSIGVFDRALKEGMVRAPLRSKAIKINTNIGGDIVSEGATKPIRRLDLSQSNLLNPVKAVAIVVTTKELLLLGDTSADTLFNKELSDAVVAATDRKFLADLIASTTPIASAGGTLANVMTDLDALLSAINTGPNSRIFLVLEPDDMKGLALKASSTGAPAFPNLGPSGGELMPGLTALTSDQLPANTAVLFAADGIAANAGIIALDSSENVVLELSDSPASPPVAATVTTSLWQADLRALRAERYFAFAIVRPTCVASLSGVNY